MTHDDFITEVARRLEWPEEKMTGIIGTILEAVSAELKLNNPVLIEGFGTLKTDIQSEYILVNPETKERHLMPPSVKVAFEPLSDEKEDVSVHVDFIPDESLYKELNIAFMQFEPTLLNDGVQLSGVSEIIAGEPEEHLEVEGYPEEDLEGEEDREVDTGPEAEVEMKTESETESEVEVEETIVELAEPVRQKESPHLNRSSRRELRSNKRTASVWIPIAGGIAIIVASLFFFKGERNS